MYRIILQREIMHYGKRSKKCIMGRGVKNLQKSFHLQGFHFHHYIKGTTFCDFLFASLDGETIPEWNLLLKERICFYGGKFFPMIVKLNLEGRLEYLPLEVYLFSTTG